MIQLIKAPSEINVENSKIHQNLKSEVKSWPHFTSNKLHLSTSTLINAFYQTTLKQIPTQLDSQTIINNWPNKNMPSKFSSRNKVTECTTQQQQQQKKILQGGLLWHKIDYPCKWTSLFSPFYNLVSLLFLHRPIQCQKITKKSDLAAHEIKKHFSVIPNEYLWTIIEEEGKEFYCTKIMIFIHSFCVFLGCSYYALDFLFFLDVCGWMRKKIVYFGWTLMNYFSDFFEGEEWGGLF